MTKNSEAEVRKKLHHILRSLSSDEEAISRGTWGTWTGAELPEWPCLSPDLVFLTLVGLQEFPCWGRGEKVFWEIPVVYKGAHFLLAHRKFGFHLARRVGDHESVPLIPEFLSAISKAVQAASPVFQRICEEQAQKGEVSVANRYHLLHGMYHFYRRRALASFRKARRFSTPDTAREPQSVATRLNKVMGHERDAFYLSVAMIDSYFSRLEHLLVLLLPFAGFNPASETVRDFMASTWVDKYKRIFDIQEDSSAKKVYDDLREIKDSYRNTFSHGLLERGGMSQFAHVGPYAVPLTLMGHYKSPLSLGFFPMREDVLRGICKSFDKADRVFHRGRMKYGLMYANSGLNVAFSSGAVASYQRACVSTASFESYLEAEAYRADITDNMDWQ